MRTAFPEMVSVVQNHNGEYKPIYKRKEERNENNIT